MKKLIRAVFWSLVILLAISSLTTAAPVCTVPAQAKPFGTVLCCCTGSDGVQCCNYVDFCGGFVPGCYC